MIITFSCNELAMQLAIYRHGPIVVGYRVYWEFFFYQRGIYYHYGNSTTFEVNGNPFQWTLWLIGRVDAFRPEGRELKSRSSRHV